MTNKQKQTNLRYLGYYTGLLDGIWGAKSKEATKMFQKAYGLVQDGIWGNATNNKIIQVWKDIQTQLGVVADGLVGTNTLNAIKKVQLEGGLVVDGIVRNSTLQRLDPWKNIKNFTKEEFRCKCGKYCNGYPTSMDMNIVRILQDIRNHYGRPITVTSGLRCKQHNANIGGASGSRHLLGKAIDFSVSGVGHWTVSAYLKKRKDIRYTYTNNTGMKRSKSY